MIETLLVANRGEIACRVFRTCRDLGIRTVAVHSDPDAGALHVREADAAVRLPGAAPADTYLRGDLVVAAALAAGADAVHPGYGFLSESAAFAREVEAAGLTWVGPPPGAVEAMASKTRAKRLLGVEPLDPDALTEADLPVLVKAAAGGGGRGMRVVREMAALPGELAAARAEALAAFGDGEVFAEPYLERGRHVEVQLLADAHGTVWPLGTRDCSLQRRHQKVVEEAPAPGLPEALVEELYGTAVRAARAVGYRGAGTVEFLVGPDGTAHFLEMNTRLQVEHPVTEAVYGVDLVALQLRVAEGAALPPEPPAPRGHAVEARLYAEDPARSFAPQTGTLHALDVPGVRLDTGYAAGDAVGVHYDALLAKAVAHAPTRAEALRLLARALERARVHGPVTNRDLLVRSLRHPEFAEPGRADTGFYARHLDALTAPLPGGRYAAVAAALAEASARPGPGAWRNLPSRPRLRAYGDGAGAGGAGGGGAGVPEAGGHEVRYARVRGGYALPDDPDVRVVSVTAREVRLEVGGVVRPYRVTVRPDSDTVHVDGPDGAHRFTRRPRFPDPAERTAPGSLLAPMPGTVVRVAEGLAAGARVEAGRPLLWLEAMKMEHQVTAPASGVLTALHAAPGDQVELGALLAVVDPAPAPDGPDGTGTPGGPGGPGGLDVPDDPGGAEAPDGSQAPAAP
ncbi:biotin carboxylase N-terminal domain-containing protein [Streptomyces rubrolavendulae]|uniref:Acetyl-/propionyl-coenzyme A carboxylase alpha chain n=1 Tax=Streptomyces rubrolavendulae TaxID=285473 RepID=A0A1D8G241_9ACTN|nr:biotin carboxylase N-terminal domain-containing protein [Streptomyces rubrolavendulae]AOT59510.1 Acetyl-/propionyl-coenzyme A carboxylase alpha chain [Streptomyces rubrolavendulae]